MQPNFSNGLVYFIIMLLHFIMLKFFQGCWNLPRVRSLLVAQLSQYRCTMLALSRFYLFLGNKRITIFKRASAVQHTFCKMHVLSLKNMLIAEPRPGRHGSSFWRTRQQLFTLSSATEIPYSMKSPIQLFAFSLKPNDKQQMQCFEIQNKN